MKRYRIAVFFVCEVEAEDDIAALRQAARDHILVSTRQNIRDLSMTVRTAYRAVETNKEARQNANTETEAG